MSESKGANGLERFIDIVDDLLRHKSVLGRHEWLRNYLRRPYHKLINIHGKGITVNIGGCVRTKLPPEFSGKFIESYESKCVEVLSKWCNNSDSGVFVDIGCSLGYISCAALFSNPSVEVIAIDSDLQSLKSTQRVCHYARGSRLTVIYGLISDNSSSFVNYKTVIEETLGRLNQPGLTGDPGTHSYVCLNTDGKTKTPVPIFSLDDLFSENYLVKRPLFIKCDVEGGEWFVVNGAKTTLNKLSPTLLLSIHPGLLAKYNRTASDISYLLSAHGYDIKVLSVDHEEHWLCEKRAT